MYSEYSLNSNELNEDFIKSVKRLFKGKRVTITVSSDVNETEYLLKSEPNKVRLLQSIKNIENGESLTPVDTKSIINEAEAGNI